MDADICGVDADVESVADVAIKCCVGRGCGWWE